LVVDEVIGAVLEDDVLSTVVDDDGDDGMGEVEMSVVCVVVVVVVVSVTSGAGVVDCCVTVTVEDALSGMMFTFVFSPVDEALPLPPVALLV
jgi:hypothetical protein